MIDSFANRLRLAMKDNNINLSKLSSLTNISKPLISNYLSGNYQAKQTNVYILAKALNVNPVWLMGYDVSKDFEQTYKELISEENKNLIFTKNEYIDKEDNLYKANININFLKKMLKENTIKKDVYLQEKKKILDNLLDNKLITTEKYNAMIKND